jgi:3-deoxy-D-arabino-heptulosonate 7-phosphate (DAHP) synthase
MFTVGASNYSKINLGKLEAGALKHSILLTKNTDSTVEGYVDSVFL